MAWEEGPLPAGTWNWGGVVPHDALAHGGFFFADFRGDHVVMNPGDAKERRLEPHEVKYYDNGLTVSPDFQKPKAGVLNSEQ
jgi:hypothetical protein